MYKAVLTTINPPSGSTYGLIQSLRGSELLVIGDRLTKSYQMKGAEFYPWDHKWPFELASILPFDTYARKNLGYLEAMRLGTDCIYETDDDTMPDKKWEPISKSCIVNHIYTQGWCNYYKWFTNADIWPRGLPLYNKDEFGDSDGPSVVESPLHQCLVNNSPDVDAIWRMMHPEKFEFGSNCPISMDGWAPTNSQNTWFFKEAFPLMYLPYTCSWRATDIWRGLIAQKCLWAMGYDIIIHPADTIQNRNCHDLLKDFEQEIPCYLYNDKIVDILGHIELGENIYENLFTCYCKLIEKKIIDGVERPFLRAWIEDCKFILK